MIRVNQLLLTIVLTCTAGAMILVLGTGGEANLDLALPDRTLKPSAVPPKTAGQDVPNGSRPLRSINEFSETTARPLFSQSRRPPSITEGDLSELDSGPGVPVERNQFLVMGIVITDEEKVALLRLLKNDDDVIRAREGQLIADWRVESITPEAVKVSKQGTTDTIRLSDNILSAAEKRKLLQKARQTRIQAQGGARNANPRQAQVRRPRVIPPRPAVRARPVPQAQPPEQAKTPVR